jgi:hypothetical protein
METKAPLSIYIDHSPYLDNIYLTSHPSTCAHPRSLAWDIHPYNFHPPQYSISQSIHHTITWRYELEGSPTSPPSGRIFIVLHPFLALFFFLFFVLRLSQISYVYVMHVLISSSEIGVEMQKLSKNLSSIQVITNHIGPPNYVEY